MKRMALLFMVICLMALRSVPPADAQTEGSGCTREVLKGSIDKYFAALEAHDPSGLPLASNVKYTENGVELPIGKGFLQTAGKILLRRDLIDDVVPVKDEDAYRTANDLAREEGILGGITSGANVSAALQRARELGPGKTIVTVVIDSGLRYLNGDLYR